MDHQKEAERLLAKSLDGETPEYFTTAEDAAIRLAWAAQAQVHATLATILPLSTRTKVDTQYGVKEVRNGDPAKVSIMTGYGIGSENAAYQDAQFKNKNAEEGVEYIPVARRALTTFTPWEPLNG
jgi:hypothetical protein